jgi:hypothetical protein
LAPAAGYGLLAEAGANLSPSAGHTLAAEGGVSLTPAAGHTLAAEGGANLAPSAGHALAAEGGASMAPTAPGQITAEYGVTVTTATLLAAITGTRNNLLLTSRTAGVTGNQISLEIQQPTGTGSLAVTVTGTRIAVLPAAGAPVAASGFIEITGLPPAGSTVTVGNRTITFVAGTPGPLQAQATGTAANVAANLRAAIDAAGGNVVGDELDGSLVRLVAVAAGSAGNLLAMAESTGGEEISVSGDTLTGGDDAPVSTTATQLKTAIEASAAANALVAVSYPALNSDGTGSVGPGIIAAYPQTYLSGGAGMTAATPPQLTPDSIY